MNTRQSGEVHPAYLIWDHEGPPPGGPWIPVRWRGFGDGTSELSIPTRVEEFAESLRARFLGWVHDAGETTIYNQRLIDHLVVRPGLSYWWMFLGVEKCDYAKLPRIYDAVRLLALESLVAERPGGSIILASDDRILARTFRRWCRNASLAFEWRRSPREHGSVSPGRRLYRSLPRPLQAAAFLLRSVRVRWPLRRGDAAQRLTPAGQITFFSYFENLDMQAASDGRFVSRYWTTLPELLWHQGRRTNWLQQYVQDDVFPVARLARELLDRFNTVSAGLQFHAFVEGGIGWTVIWRTARDYGRLILMGLRLRKARRLFVPAHSNVDLWPLFEQGWRNSLFGTAAMSNCLFLNLCECVLAELPRQELGVYLQENQAWEVALAHAWKAAGHGRLVGVPHSTVRYWDMRYYFDPRSYQRGVSNELPRPDFVAVNGPAACQAFRQAGYPESQIVLVEALRYLYLAEAPPRTRGEPARAHGPLRLLVLGDYLRSATCRQMEWLAAAARTLPADIRVVVKPHPNCPILASDYPHMRMQVTDQPLAELLCDCDVAYSSNITSSAVDAYSMGVPVVSVLDGSAFNVSPLRGLTGVQFVTSPKELADALSGASHAPAAVGRADYFTVDPTLSHWKVLLSTVGNPDRGCHVA